MRTIGDAKSAIALEYPKLFARFNQAFHAFSDETEIEEAMVQITADVEGWLSSMPENFKTSHHALSRPKFGALYVLKNESVRERWGEDECDKAINAIESQWDACKRKLVAVAAPAPAASVQASAQEDDVGLDADKDKEKDRLISTLAQGVRQLLSRHYDETVVDLFDGLMACNRST